MANPSVTETITAPDIAAGVTYDYTFTTNADLSAVGSYDLKVSVTYPAIPLVTNDTLTKIFKQLDNPPINLNSDFLDDIETAYRSDLYVQQIGLDGKDRYDFVT